MEISPAPNTKSQPFGAWERMIASRYVKSRRQEGGVALVSLVSFVGITLAVAILIIVMSVMNGFRNELLSRILGVNGHINLMVGDYTQANSQQIIIELKNRPHIKSLSPIIQGQALVSNGGNSQPSFVQGVRKEDLSLIPELNSSIVGGNLQNYGKGEYGGDEIIIGYRLAANLGVQTGDYVTLLSPNGSDTIFGSTPRAKDYKIGAIFNFGMNQYDAGLIYMPLEQAQLYFNRENRWDMIEIRLDNPEISKDITHEIKKIMPEIEANDWQTSNDFVEALGVERAVMRLILLLLVLIASLNIISGLVMLVKNKGRDIAILRTMGATQGSILRIFIMIGASIGILGTILGVLLGVLFCLNIHTIQILVEMVFGKVFPDSVYFLSQIPAHVEWREVFITASFAFIVSVVVTLFPSIRAARLDPVEALRYE